MLYYIILYYVYIYIYSYISLYNYTCNTKIVCYNILYYYINVYEINILFSALPGGPIPHSDRAEHDRVGRLLLNICLRRLRYFRVVR